ncbi:hypothetical protein TI10_03505 [Photorhabdus luminescens subsp. luminescens]|uniref:Uncharacterized protein n=1 Tax=Photorhabdus luminescens TaxID=29488 RepID=A0A1G5PSM4_PHOLU|nr:MULTISPECIES: hypothetical protein [Photorhabdus]KMW74830.1 hypothetical protein TI10_03505 [Photorhabdus luminescens subsp. luminescens]MCW7550998.1 hypothetical protein [Photorhabdus aballayi]MCW7763274.1 hypothetical protein [Photorhabdus luminescens subsp. venezuelensis]SCZ52554.1 hypothetical protein SAMN02982990_00398 [Photorhabdus luminescens]
MKKLAVMLALGMISFGAMAVDGYKDAKFGMTEEEFLSKRLCDFEKFEGDSRIEEVSLYSCSDFSFANKKREAMAFFLNGKFKRLEINIGRLVKPVSKSLTKKYGDGSSYPSKEEFENALKYNGTMSIGYDNNTVLVDIHIICGKEGIETSQLIYTSPDVYTLPDFGEKIQELKGLKEFQELLELDREKLDEDV